MSNLSTAKMSSKQYLMLGEDPPGLHLELAHGEIVVSPSPSPNHSEVIVNLVQLLAAHVKGRKLGKIYLDTDTVFDEENTRRPDILFFTRGRLDLVGKNALLGAPDLCVEVFSPSSVEMDREDKFALYEKRKVSNYWIVDEDARTIESFVLKRGKFQLAAQGKNNQVVHLPPFLNLAIPLAEIWPES
jgi:Uma2 family endonuclease